jgi:hypothetical protein
MPTTIDFVYRESDLENNNNTQTSNLYSSTSFENVIGFLMAQINLNEKSDGTQFNSFDTTYCTFYLNNNQDTVLCYLALYNQSSKNRLNKNDFYTFQIIGGSGKYLGATGNVYWYIDDKAIRYVKIIIN